MHFCDKSYQEMNFKSHLNSVPLCKQGKILSDLPIFYLILFHFTCLVLTFATKLKDANYKCHWNILVFCDQWKMISDLEFWFWKSFFFNHKNDVRFVYALSNDVWFGLYFVVWVEFWQ